ncbi:hypothetical protein H0H92_013732 [Tricholoma furcatifolium]|nr:hypothetical protein H0H92_013732 [Tricholoma furcatifolium]
MQLSLNFVFLGLIAVGVRAAPISHFARAASAAVQLQNGLDAQTLNAQFASLTIDSSCTDGDVACINGDFAECANGQYQTNSCGSGLTCVALPLVNSAGTSVTCDTTADALTRIAATGATGGLTGSGSTTSATSAVAAATTSKATKTAKTANAKAQATSTAAAAASTASSSDFHLQNGLDAQALNAEFATLTIDSTCSDDDVACINGDFAECANGQYQTTSCGSGLTCVALPLVNSAGTSVTCDTTSDALTRIAATGATGGLTGSGSTTTAATSAANVDAVAATSTASAAASTSSDFHLQNGLDAQALNAEFTTLTIDSSCTEGEVACINGDFAECANGQYQTSSCGSGLTCVALPLVNSAGTSVTCDTTADALTRIAATGATGGLTGSGSSSSSTSAATTAAANVVASTTTASSTSSDFHLQNGLDAQALNAEFASLTLSSSCTEGEVACINGDFAECANGQFQTTSCGSGLTCVALPLVNSAGTSVTCDTTADALTRIAATGATGGLTGA